jgi:hypothetical protein
LKKCITYNKGVGKEEEGKVKVEWIDIRVGAEEG